MSRTPICDFVRAYAASGPARFHMPGHKGSGPVGAETLDITEISGADDLYHASGIIAESEANASRLFGCPTFYSTEGSSLCIRIMLYLACFGSGKPNRRILAGRNAHKTLLFTAALLDLDITWLYPAENSAYQSCPITPEELDEAISAMKEPPAAVYLTSPDYLGNVLDLAALSAVCRRHGVLLLVDNAHGAYLRFLTPSRHPIDLGADLCCDSAHKTLPVLTGGAYLHLAPALEGTLSSKVKPAMALFGSTSPSYLILQSLDYANVSLETLPGRLTAFLGKLARLKETLRENGLEPQGNEPLKLTLSACRLGYSGEELSRQLESRGVFPEFADEDSIVFMLSPENSDEDLARLAEALLSAEKKSPRAPYLLVPPRPPKVMSVREACFAPWEELPVESCLGRISASPAVACPPAIPVVMCGEVIDETCLSLFRHYGITTCRVVSQE